MDLFEALKGRRSVRAYKDEQIKDEELNKILEAGDRKDGLRALQSR